MRYTPSSRPDRLTLTDIPAVSPVAEPSHADNGDRIAPASHAQQQLWFLDRLERGSPKYSVPIVLRLRGPLDLPALDEAITSVVRRHEVLRTVFVEVDGAVHQRVRRVEWIEVPVEDMAVGRDPSDDVHIRERIQEIVNAPFDLERGPLFRQSVVRLAPTDHVLVLCLHHVIYDGGSRGILMADIHRAYEAARAGEPTHDSEPAPQFIDLADQTRAPLEADRDYWRHALQGAPTELAPLRASPPNLQPGDPAGGVLAFALSADLFSEVQRISVDTGATPFAVMLTTYYLVLARWTGAEDLVVGVVTDTRESAAEEATIGNFANTMPLLARVDESKTFGELLEEVAECTWDGLAHSRVPFDEIVRMCRPERTSDRQPLVQASFGLFVADEPDYLSLGGLDVESWNFRTGTSKFDISIDLLVAGGAISGELEYDRSMLDESDADRFLAHWTRALTVAVRQPHVPLHELPTLSEAELETGLRSWNRTAIPSEGRAMRLDELFRRSVVLQGDKLAVVAGSQRLTYAELSGSVYRLANLLVDLDVGIESRVGILLPRSADSVVAMFAVLIAGGAFVPLDPDLPDSRLAFMLENSAVDVLVCDSSTARQVPQHHRLLNLNEMDSRLAQAKLLPPEPNISPSTLACLFYTSGSTGTPKGAMLTHANLANYFHFFQDRYRLDETVTAQMQLSSFSFDLFISDAMLTLFVGSTLVVCPREVMLDPPALYALMKKEKVDCAEFVPALLGTLLDYLEDTDQDLSFMSLLIAGGDQWHSNDLLRVRRRVTHGTQIVCAYGLTEAAVDNAHFAPAPTWVPVTPTVPIGTPISNNQIYVFDRWLRPVPIGVAGELYIGGDGLGRGYFGRPGLTAERFVANPVSEIRGSRLYRTGDRAFYDKYGVIHVVGRTDNQVKVRGFRVELGEVESAVRDFPGIRDCVVIATETKPGQRRLTGLIRPRDNDAGQGFLNDLRSHLRSQLPAYMRPSSLVLVDDLPLNANGKLDRAAALLLLANAPKSTQGEVGRVPVAEPVVQVVLGLWAEMLDTEAIDADESFFELGGHSLLLAKLVARIRDTMGINLPLRDIYDHPTAQSLAARIADFRSEIRDQPTIESATIRRRKDPLRAPVSGAQAQVWFHDRAEPASTTYVLPATYHLVGGLDIWALAGALRDLITRHEVLRTVLIEEGGIPHQRILDPFDPAITLTDVSLTPQELAKRVIEEELAREEGRPFTHGGDPLIRVHVVRVSPDEHLLTLTLHHAVADSWSFAILWRELEAFYRGRVAGKSPEMSELPVQYADYSAWFADGAESVFRKRLIEFWQQNLNGAPALTELPLDRPRDRDRATAGDGAAIDLDLSADLLRDIRTAASREAATVFMVILAGFQTALCRWAGLSDLVIGVPMANRSRPQVEDLIGLFVNVLPVRLRSSDTSTFRKVVGGVRDSLLDVAAHQELPFEQVVSAVRPDRSMAVNPLFQIVANFDDTSSEHHRLPGLTVTRYPPRDVTTVTFDLTLFLEWHGDEIRGQLRYRSDIFDEGTMADLADMWRHALEAGLADPDLPISRWAGMKREQDARIVEVADTYIDEVPPTSSSPPDVRLGLDNAIKDVVAGVWMETMGLPRVADDDNFFRLGGTSMMALRVCAQIGSLFATTVAVREVFEHPVLGDFAAAILAGMKSSERNLLATALAGDSTMGRTRDGETNADSHSSDSASGRSPGTGRDD